MIRTEETSVIYLNTNFQADSSIRSKLIRGFPLASKCKMMTLFLNNKKDRVQTTTHLVNVWMSCTVVVN